mgnify:CR=1 FL=1
MTSNQNTEKNKATYQRFIQEVFNKGRLELLPEILSPTYVLHDAPAGMAQGPDAIKQTVTMFRAAFPDLEITLEELVAEGNKVCARSMMRGTHKGTLFGKPASGKKVEVPGLTMVTVIEGRVIESWVRNDVATLMKQIE